MGNQITLGILKAFKEEGIKIPDDISLVTFDEQIYSDLLLTPLTTVSHMNENLGDVALKMLLDQIDRNDNKKPQNVILNSKLIIRESVKNLIRKNKK
jgi:LacI family transcriptional regulator